MCQFTQAFGKKSIIFGHSLPTPFFLYSPDVMVKEAIIWKGVARSVAARRARKTICFWVTPIYSQILWKSHIGRYTLCQHLLSSHLISGPHIFRYIWCVGLFQKLRLHEKQMVRCIKHTLFNLLCIFYINL